MKRFILAFSMFSIWLAIASSYYICVIKGMCFNNDSENNTTIKEAPIVKKELVPLKNDTAIVSAQKNIDSLAATSINEESIDTLKVSGLKIIDNNSLIKAYSSNFKIYNNSANVKIPLGISEYGYLIAKHMDSVNSSLLIKGYYNEEELAEKGLQRAQFIKERLTKLGIPDLLIETTAVAAIFEYNYNKFIGGIQFDFKKVDSIIKLNQIDYTLLEKSTDKIDTTIDFDTVSNNKPQTIVEKDIKITDIDLESITKNKSTNLPPAVKEKKEKVPAVKKEAIKYTVTSKDFRNNKFKASKNFKKFIETHKAAKSMQLYGYSNANKNIDKNYSKGLELANLVKSYLTDKGIFNGKMTSTASKKEYSVENNAINEGVTLIIQ